MGALKSQWIEEDCLIIKFLPIVVDIECMKKLTLIMMFGFSSVVLNAEEFTIQTISAQKAASITPAFEKKISKSALPSAKIQEGSCHIVTVGKYPDAKAAHHDLKKAKSISKDAFVRSTHRQIPKTCGSAVESPHAVQKAGEHNVSSPVVAVEVKKEAHAEAHPVVVDKNVTTTEVKEVPCKAQPCEKVSHPVYVYDRNSVRKSDIHEAIEYYRTSPYHSFTPVGLQAAK